MEDPGQPLLKKPFQLGHLSRSHFSTQNSGSGSGAKIAKYRFRNRCGAEFWLWLRDFGDKKNVRTLSIIYTSVQVAATRIAG